MPYEVVIQERKRVDLYGNVVYYIYWFDKYGYDITNEWKFWSKGSKKKSNTLSFNWDSYGEKITQEEFDDFVNKVDRSQLPEGIKFELK